LPFDEITRIVAPDDAQRSALGALRASATAGAQRLSAHCPQDEPAPPSARLEAVEQAIDTVTASLAAVDPSLRGFYAALDDEQKARLLRDLTLSGSQAREGERAAERFKHRRRERGVSVAAHDSEADAWAGICEQLSAALRGWPIPEIEHRVRLSEPQRVAFYELVSSSLKVADALARACPAETALTPPARMAQLRARLAAVRQATAAIRPGLTQFYEALDQGQKVHFAGIH
jgi:LTXXQ motif family protein